MSRKGGRGECSQLLSDMLHGLDSQKLGTQVGSAQLSKTTSLALACLRRLPMLRSLPGGKGPRSSLTRLADKPGAPLRHGSQGVCQARRTSKLYRAEEKLLLPPVLPTGKYSWRYALANLSFRKDNHFSSPFNLGLKDFEQGLIWFPTEHISNFNTRSLSMRSNKKRKLTVPVERFCSSLKEELTNQSKGLPFKVSDWN